MSAEREFPGDPVVKSVFSSAGGMGSIPFQGTKIPYAVQHSQLKKKQLIWWLKIKGSQIGEDA